VGSGKTFLAEWAHRLSGREGSLIIVSAGELTGNLYSDTLFGHVPGAFTGAKHRRAGAVERAARGTLLIDDLALMPIAAQTALLRVMESRRYRPVGADTDQSATARFCFASSRSIRALLKEEVLLPDLVSRIGEFVISVPPLRERREEILPLAQQAAAKLLADHRVATSVEFTAAAAEMMQRYPWPQNVRELRAVAERAVVHAGMRSERIIVTPSHLPDRLHREWPDDAGVALSRSLIESVLEAAGGNKSEAARRLGIHRNTIMRYLKGTG
jgi:DNA-binding NtrC family response regulator